MQCSLAEAGLCSSCTRLGIPYAEQLAAKDARVRAVLAGLAGADTMAWDSPAASAERAFRNKAKLAVGGTCDTPTLGILDANFLGIDVAACPLYDPAVAALIPALRAFITRAGLTPYDPASNRGELKYIHLTASPAGVPMIRFVVRSTECDVRLRKHLPWLLNAIAAAAGEDAANGAVISRNLLPQRAALTEGAEEHVVTQQAELVMELGWLSLRLRPGAFFQTNTGVATQLYRTAQEWVGAIEADVHPAQSQESAAMPTQESGVALRIWDVYCGVGGFALAVAGPSRQVLGIETSPAAVAAARSAAEASGQDVRIVEGDAEAATYAHGAPHIAIVNPPRRGIGEVAAWLDASPVPYMLYSSCNPATLASDFAEMESFELVRGRVFDMFAHTDHAEVLVLARRRA